MRRPSSGPGHSNREFDFVITVDESGMQKTCGELDLSC